MEKISFLHCSDLHLGCMPNHLETRYNDFFESFLDLINNAIKNQCKYLLIAGDLFHLKVINSKTLLDVIRLLEYAKENNIQVIAIEGNHDKAFYVDEKSWLHFLEQKHYLHLLTHKIKDGVLILDEDSIYEDNNIRIIGIGYLGSATSIYLKSLSEQIQKNEKFTVLMLHASINRLCGEEMGDINLETLLSLENIVDYVALGHIHSRYEYNDFIYNPGSIENIRIKDGRKSNKKGFYIVNVENNKKDVTFIESKKRKIINKTIQLEENITIEEVENYILNQNFVCEAQAILELTIYGKVSFNPYLINFEIIKKKLIEKYDFIYIDINNLINIINNETTTNNLLDIKSIEKDAINRFLTINYPKITEVNAFVDEVLNLKQALLEDKEYNVIIDAMSKLGETICD